MNQLLIAYVTVATMLGAVRERATRDDRGSLTMEQAVIGAALFGAAVALLAVIARVVSERAGQIG